VRRADTEATKADLPRILEICREASDWRRTLNQKLLTFMEEYPDGFLVAAGR